MIGSKPSVEQSTVETLDIDMCLTSRICEGCQRWRNRVIFWQTPWSGKRQLRGLARASVWQMMLALVSPPCCARVNLGSGFPHKAAHVVFWLLLCRKVRASTKRKRQRIDQSGHFGGRFRFRFRPRVRTGLITEELGKLRTRVIHALAGSARGRERNLGFSPCLLGQRAWL
jgi:hypothetical protein